jgi:uncharacterized protein YecE (DUF72 family)
VPGDFVFSVKAPKFITHVLKLDRAATPLANFFASGLANLRGKLGAILWQLPPSLPFDGDLIETFIAQLPHDDAEASTLARKHDKKVEGRASLDFVSGHPVRHVLEVRNRTFDDARFVALAREHRVGIVIGDGASKWPYIEDLTTDFVYLRLHGLEETYPEGYTGDALERWAARIRAWREGGEPADARRVDTDHAPATMPRDVYCYFDNDQKALAPRDAQSLAGILGIATPA